MRGLQSQNMKLVSSELQQRLEHLVTYSTQMIFVSGEGVGRQYQLAEGFLAEQGSDTNIAYFPANDSFSIEQYRHKILSQLASASQFDSKRPLAESFSRNIDHSEGSLLICISGAEHLPKPFLKELWDLVLQNRFARDRFHLNVLLFADEQWATQAKSWLPVQNQEQPVLVSAATTQQQSSSEQHSGSELDQLIAEKRKKFAERIEKRQQSYHQERPLPLIKTWWMKLLIACVFLLSFGSILLWQHYDVTKEALSEFTQFLFQNELEQPQDTQDKTAEENTPEMVATPEVLPEGESQPVQEDASPAAQEEQSVRSNGSERLVTDWKSAIKSLDDKLVTVNSEQTEITSEAQAQLEPQTEAASGPIESTEIPVVEVGEAELVTGPEPETTQAVVNMEQIQTSELAEVQDYAVPDIVPEPSDTSQNPAYNYDELQLLQLLDSQYLLQLSAMSSRQVLQGFITQHQLEQKAWIYVTQRYGGDWHVLLLAQPFDTLDSARKAVTGLSASLQQIKPFAKSVSQIRKEIESD